MKTKKIVVFDLDDTLFKEIDYLKSAYRAIAERIAKSVNSSSETVYNDMWQFYTGNLNAFDLVLKKYTPSLNIDDLLAMYRNHLPDLVLSEDTKTILDFLKEKQIQMGLITDGRSIQQRNKLKALEIESYFSEIVISEEFGSEKPDLRNFQYFENLYGNAQYYYIGDNVKKDFVAPNALGWVTIRLKDNGLNIHKSPDDLKNNKSYCSQFEVDELSEVLKIIT